MRPAVILNIVLGFFVLSACGACDGGRGALVPKHATLLPQPKALAEFHLIDQSGNQFTRDALRGKWTMMFFGFTHCPDICPATLQKLAAARDRIAGRSSSHAHPDIVLISVDPDRDSVDVLGQYVGYFGADVSGITGDLAEIRRLAAQFGVFFEREAASDGNYNVSHSTAVMLINPDAEFHAVFGSALSIDDIAHDLPIVMARR